MIVSQKQYIYAALAMAANSMHVESLAQSRVQFTQRAPFLLTAKAERAS